MDYPFVSIDRIFTKLGRDLRSDLDETDIIEWTGEALEFIGTKKLYQESVAFIEVINHQCDLPKGLHAIIQVARNNNWSKSILCSPEATRVQLEGDVASVPVPLDTRGMPLEDYDVAYYRPFFDLRLEVNAFSNSYYYKRHFTPVRLATNSMFNSIVCPNKSNHMGTGKDEYKVIMGKSLRFSFERGCVAVAYLGQITDTETGYPMIPDDISHTTAITKYISLKKAEKDADRGKDGAEQRVARYDRDWQWYCKQSRNKSMMPNVDELQNLLDQKSYLIPQNNRYYGFFGNLNAPNNTLYGGTARNINDGRVLDHGSDEIIITNTTEIINNFGGENNIAEDKWD